MSTLAINASSLLASFNQSSNVSSISSLLKLL